MKLSIIIISYNTKAMTINCLRSVIEQTKIDDYEVIVLDNNSSDGSAYAIRTNFPDVQLIESKENMGFAKGNNVAALNASGDYILLLNPDTVIFDHAIDKLYTFAKSSQSEGIFGGRTYLGDGTFDPTSCWKKPSLWSVFCFAVGLTAIFNRNRFFDPESYGGWKRDTVRNVDIITGCFLLLKKKTWDALNGFSIDFFMYAEEADLCLRAQKIGVQPVIVPDAKIIHFGGASEKVAADKMVRMLKAQVTFIRKHWDNRLSVWLGTIFYLSGAFIRAWYPVGILFPSEKVLQWRETWRRRKQWVSGK